MKIIAEKSFTEADQKSFASLSGDSNPMHMDEVAARRTVFASPVVHGMHLVCWALENWFATNTSHRSLSKLTANFGQPVLVGTMVQAAVTKEDEQFSIEIRKDQGTASLIQGSLGPAVNYPHRLPELNHQECRVLDFAAAAEAQGNLPLSYCAPTMSRVFPRLSAALPPVQLAALLTTTRLVGMECPGLHSVYSSMNLSFSGAPAGQPEMRFHVENADARFALLRLAVEGPGFQGKLSALVRPAPRRQAGMQAIAQLVKQGEFGSQRAVVIGGSRGLGEVTAKLLAAGGAEVLITYRLGKKDADAVAAEIKHAGGRCTIAAFDTNRPTSICEAVPTHVYYFSTPHISAEKSPIFSAERFAEYCRYYVTGFAESLQVLAQGATDLDVLYPSTIFLEGQSQLPEYCAAKAAGEEMCRQLSQRFPAWRFHVPRLPRLQTDQNNGFVAIKADAPESALLPHLRRMGQKSEC